MRPRQSTRPSKGQCNPKSKKVHVNKSAFDIIDLRSEPGFELLQDIRSLCARYIEGDDIEREDEDIEAGDTVPQGLANDHFKDQEMVDRATAWAREFDGVIAYLEAASRGKRAIYPKGTPRFEDPKAMMSYFKDRWEKLKCRYC